MWMTALLLWAAGAQAFDRPDAAALSERARAIAPAVERAAGRTFDEVPEVVVADRRGLRALLVAQWAAKLSRAGLDGDPEAQAAPELALVMRAAAVYSTADGRIYAVEEQFRQHAERFAPEILPAIIDCILAHELTHALQDRYAPNPPLVDPDAALRVRMVREGHASVVAHRVCQAEHGPAATTVFDDMSGPGRAATADPLDDTDLSYAFAPLWVVDIERTRGWEAAWQVLSEMPPDREALRAAAASVRVADWADRAVLVEMVSRAVPDPGQVGYEGTSTTWVGSALSGARGGGPIAELPRSAAGHLVTAERGNTGLAVFLASGDSLAPWVAWRRAQARAGEESERGSWHFFATTGMIRAFESGVSKRLGKVENVRETLVILADSYSEVWAATDDHLALAWSRQNVDGKRLEKLVGEALGALSPGAPAADVDTMLDGPAEQPVPDGVASSWQVVYTTADRHRVAGEYAECLGGLHGEVSDPVAWPWLVNLRYLCAVMAEDLRAADRTLAAMADPTRPDPQLIALHAVLRLEADRTDDALSLVRSIPDPLDPLARALRADIELVAAAEAGDWDRAIPMAVDSEASPQTRLSVGVYLAGEAEHAQAARAVLSAVCPLLTGPERAECDQALGGL